MSKKSRETRRERRAASVTPLRELLAQFQAPSLISLVESAAISPLAAHRAPSLGRLFFDAVRLWPDGHADAAAADLPQLVSAVRTRNPEFAGLEDYVPLDPRREVITDWGGRAYRLLPGSLERPVAMFERARMIDRATGGVLLNAFGFTISDLGELILTRLDEVANMYSPAWPAGSDRPSPSDEPVVSEREVECARCVPDIATLIARYGTNGRVARALTWATKGLDELVFRPQDGNSMFGPVVAVRLPEQTVPVPTGFWPDSFEASLVRLAHEAARADGTASERFRLESERALKRLFTMSRLQLVGPFSLQEGAPSVFALLIDERTVMLLDLVTVLDAFDPVASATVPRHFAALADLGGGSVLRGPSGELRLRANTHVVRTLILGAAAHAVTSGHPPVAAASLDDLRWIATKTRETPEDIFYFFDELANGDPKTEIMAFETINTFEHWRANGKSISRQGRPWNLISIEPHRGDAEWDDAADWTPAACAMRTMQFSPLRTWDGYERHKRWPSCSFGMFPQGPLWELRFERPFVAVQCFGLDTPRQYRGTLINVAQSIHWKLDRSPELQATLLPFAVAAGIRIIFTQVDDPDWPAIRFVRASATMIELGFVSDLANRIVADAPRVEHEIAESIAHGLGELAQIDLNSASFVRAYDAAPPGLRSEETELPVRAAELPEPITLQLAAISVAERDLARALREAGVEPGTYEGPAATQLESQQIAPILRTMLERAMSAFDCKEVLEFALEQVERCLCNKWSEAQLRRQNERFPVLAYDPVELEITEEQESHKLTRLVTVIAEEAVVSSQAGGSERVNRLAWIQLLAIAHLLMDSYLRSESNHYGIVPAVTKIDSMYSITQQHPAADASLIDQAAFLEARARFRMAGNVADSARTNEAQIKALHTQISRSLFEAYGYHLETIVTILDVGRYWTLPPGQEIVSVSIDEFLQRCSEIAADLPTTEARAALEHLILKSEDLSEFIEHWELERRPVRLMTRPFVRVGNDRFYVLPWQCDGSRRVFLGYFSQGRLIWANGDAVPELRQALDALREARNKSLEIATEEVFLRITPHVRRNVKKPAVIGLDNTSWAGEIDCIAAVDSTSTIWVADAKDVFATFSPTTVARSIQRFSGPDQYVDKLLKKAAVVSGAADVVAKALGAGNTARAWTVRPLMVTRFVEPAAFARGQRVPFCPLSEVEEFVNTA